MTKEQRAGLLSFEGRRVSLALTDGTRLDDCQLVSAGRGRADSLWLFNAGSDTFVAVDRVADVWEAPHPGTAGGAW